MPTEIRYNPDMQQEINDAVNRGTQRIQGRRRWDSVLDAILAEFANESDSLVLCIEPEQAPRNGDLRFKRVMRLTLGELRRMRQ